MYIGTCLCVVAFCIQYFPVYILPVCVRRDTNIDHNIIILYTPRVASVQEKQAEILVRFIMARPTTMLHKLMLVLSSILTKSVIYTHSRSVSVIYNLQHYTILPESLHMQKRYWCLSRAWTKWRLEHVREFTSLAAVQQHHHALLQQVNLSDNNNRWI